MISVLNEIQGHGVVTILEHECSLVRILKQIQADPSIDHIVVDQVLKVGLSEYRFLHVPVLEDGSLDVNNMDKFFPTKQFTEEANRILQKYPKRVKYSILTRSSQNIILRKENV